MSNDITKREPSSMPVIAAHAEGDGIAVGYADSFSPTVNIIMADGKKSALSSDYFNLIIGYDPFSSDHILIDPKRALTEYISDEVKSKFGGWSDEAIERIKKLPAIIAMERDGTEEQQAVLAFITDIKIQDNGIKVYFQKYLPLSFSFLKDNLSDLAMYLFELTRTHWTIKKVDLIEVLQDVGVFPGKR